MDLNWKNDVKEEPPSEGSNLGKDERNVSWRPGVLKNQGKQIPFMLLLPALKPYLDNDKEMQLQTLFNRLRKNEIAKEQFVRLMRNIVGDQVIRLAVAQLKPQPGSNHSKLQSQFVNQQNLRMSDHPSEDILDPTPLRVPLRPFPGPSPRSFSGHPSMPSYYAPRPSIHVPRYHHANYQNSTSSSQREVVPGLLVDFPGTSILLRDQDGTMRTRRLDMEGANEPQFSPLNATHITREEGASLVRLLQTTIYGWTCDNTQLVSRIQQDKEKVAGL